jgi:hypothetical protein
MSQREARRDVRYRFEIPVTVIARSGDAHLVTENVSYRGFFLRTKTPPPKMQLLRLQLSIPNLKKEVLAHGMAVYVTGPEVPIQGAGVSFFAMDAELRKDWDTFIAMVRDVHEQQPQPAPRPRGDVRVAALVSGGARETRGLAAGFGVRERRSAMPGALQRRTLAPAAL